MRQREKGLVRELLNKIMLFRKENKRINKMITAFLIVCLSIVTQYSFNLPFPILQRPVFAVGMNINYDIGDGNGQPNSQSFEKGKSVTITQNSPTKDGYDFLGWSDTENDPVAMYQPGGSYYFSDSITLYAVWRDQSFLDGTYHFKENVSQAFTEWIPEGLNKLPETSGDYYLGDDITLPSSWTVPEGIVNLDLNGHTISLDSEVNGQSVLIVNNQSKLNLFDKDDNSGKITGGELGITNNGGILRIFGGTIFENFSQKNNSGGGIKVKNNGSVIMFGGEICGLNSFKSIGISIQNGSTFHMLGGSINNNGYDVNDQYSCGVSLSGSELIMDGGVISGNRRGVITYAAGSVFTMNDGKITDNYYSGITTEGNYDISEDARSKNYILGGEISGNGYGIEASGDVKIYGGIIKENRSVGIHINGKVEMDGGTINENAAGGVYIGAGIFDIKSGEIIDNNAEGIFLSTGGVLYLSGGTISGNTSGGIYYRCGGIFQLSGNPVIKENTKKGQPYDLYIEGGVKTGSYVDGAYVHTSIITISDELSLQDRIGVVMGKPGTFTTQYHDYYPSTVPTTFFYSQMTDYYVGLDENGEVKLAPQYKAVFKADGNTVGEVPFLEGDTGLDQTLIPAVPAKTHYDGEWEEYDVQAATDNIIINAVYTLNNNHSYVTTVVAPTCTEKGYTFKKCSICNDNYVVEGTYTNALGHDYHLNSAKSVAAGPGTEGYEYYECSRNTDHFYTVPLAAQIITHKAIFKSGETIVAEVVFEEGSESITEPAVPEKSNFVGRWEDYDLSSVTSDIVIEALYTAVDPGAVSEATTEAQAEYKDSEVTIRLTASAPTTTIKVMKEVTRPVDVVMVLDQSGSMADTLSAAGGQSKRDALVNCASDFIEAIFENAVKTKADHRVALVGFAYSSYNNGQYKNTGLLATRNGGGVNYSRISSSDYKNALIPVNNGGSLNARLTAGIDSIVAEGATSADLGLKMASNIFSENPANGERDRIVIFLTDGTPTCWGETPKLITQTAAEAIGIANTLKNAQDAKIYSIGVEKNADPGAAFTTPDNGVTTNFAGSFVSYDFNRFLHAISSDYPKSSSMSGLGEGSKSGGYYMAVNDTANLGRIFSNILYNTVYELKTLDKVTLHYTITGNLILTMEQEQLLRKDLREAQGLSDEDISIDREADGTSELTFRNVPVKDKYDTDGILRKTAEVAFKVSVNKDVTGTTAVGKAGYAESGGALIDGFEIPAISVPAGRRLLVFTINGQVYRMEEVEAGDSIIVPESELAVWEVDDSRTVQGDETWIEIEARAVASNDYAIRWVIDGVETVSGYPLGGEVTPPEVPNKEGYVFTGWTPEVPALMPARSMVMTAIYSPEHEHTYVEAYKTGSCDEGITTVYRCLCGETKTERAAALAHAYKAVLSDNGLYGTTVERLACSNCGHTQEKHVTYLVTYSKNRKTRILDLNMYADGVSVSDPGNGLEMRFYLGEDADGTYTVRRIDSDGTVTSYNTRVVDGYLVFDPDHFSIYTITEGTEGITYGECEEAMSSSVIPSGHSITFNGNGGTASRTSDVTDVQGLLVGLPTAERNGYSFEGWFTESSGGIQVSTATEFDSDAVIYAHWKKESADPGTGGNGSGNGNDDNPGAGGNGNGSANGGGSGNNGGTGGNGGSGNNGGAAGGGGATGGNTTYPPVTDTGSPAYGKTPSKAPEVVEGGNKITTTTEYTDGSVGVKVEETNGDGTRIVSETVTGKDGSRTSRIVETAADSSRIETSIESDANGNTSTKVVTTDKDGNVVLTETGSETRDPLEGKVTRSRSVTSADGASAEQVEVFSDGDGMVSYKITDKEGNTRSERYEVIGGNAILREVAGSSGDIIVPDKIKDLNDREYPVTVLGVGALDGVKVSCLTLGANIQKVETGALNGQDGLKKIIVTKAWKKMFEKDSLKGAAGKKGKGLKMFVKNKKEKKVVKNQLRRAGVPKATVKILK